MLQSRENCYLYLRITPLPADFLPPLLHFSLPPFSPIPSIFFPSSSSFSIPLLSLPFFQSFSLPLSLLSHHPHSFCSSSDALSFFIFKSFFLRLRSSLLFPLLPSSPWWFSLFPPCLLFLFSPD